MKAWTVWTTNGMMDTIRADSFGIQDGHLMFTLSPDPLREREICVFAAGQWVKVSETEDA